MDSAQIFENVFLQRNEHLYNCTKYEDSQVQQFYDGATVFITGGTGFMGKHLIEKILSLIEERLSEMLKDPVYDLLREKLPLFEQKLVPIAGDVAELRLGMSDDDWNIVTQQTEIIFHVAATTRFDEALRVATLTNVRGTRETLILGTHCNKLKTYVHVSTSYTHARNNIGNNPIMEDFYPSPVDPEALIKLVETVEEERLNNITQSLIKSWPNTYAFTKAVSEELVRTKGRNLPICVVRPAIVICAHREPRPGWLDSSCVYGAAGLNLAGSLGAAHGIYISRDIKLGYIPVDHVNNAIITAGCETANKLDQNIKIYTVTTSNRNAATYGKMQKLLDEAAHEYPLPNSVGCYFIILTRNPVIFFIYSWIFHIIPAYIVDGILLLMGKKRIATKMAMKLYRMSKALSYFTLNNWNFEDKNLAALYEKQTPRDKQIFDFDVTKIDWKEYLTIFGMGIRKYIIKDGLTGTEYGRKKQIAFRILMLFVFPLYLYMLYKIPKSGVSILAYIFNFIWYCPANHEIVSQSDNILFLKA